VIVPFSADLHYFYLYIKRHIEETHNIECLRADERIQSGFMTEKIIALIRSADILVADITGRNANVFYELGIAHDQDKKVIIITRDPVESAPTDIKHYEIIAQSLADHDQFIRRLDQAISNAFQGDYERLYSVASKVFKAFQAGTSAQVKMVDQSSFTQKVMVAEQTEDVPALDDEGAVARFALPRIIADATSVALMERITTWLSSQYGADDVP
jgi:hypothetical protein